MDQLETAAMNSATGEIAGTAPGDWATGAHPWRRYFARAVDNSFNAAFFFFTLALVMAGVAPESLEAFLAWLTAMGRIADIVLSVLAGTAINVLLLALTGSTLGKLIFGIRVREADGSRLRFTRALRREFTVWFKGLAMGIPGVSLITLSRGYNQLNDFKETTWDRDMQLVVTHRPQSILQVMLWVLVGVLWFATAIYSVLP